MILTLVGKKKSEAFTEQTSNNKIGVFDLKEANRMNLLEFGFRVFVALWQILVQQLLALHLTVTVSPKVCKP